VDYDNLNAPQVLAVLGMAVSAIVIVFLFNSYLARLAAQ